MKLLFVSPVGVIGGAERILIECVRQTRLLRPEWNLSAILLADGPLRQTLVELGVDVEIVALPRAMAAAGDSKHIASPELRSETLSRSFIGRLTAKWNQIRRIFGRGANAVLLMPAAILFLWKLRRAIQNSQPGLIHSNGLKSHLCLSMVKPGGIPTLWHIHDFYSHRPRIGRWIRLASKRTSGCIAISRAVEDDIRKEIPGMQSYLLLNCVDTDHFCPGPADTDALDRAAGLPIDVSNEAILRVGLVATYARWKGQDVFLQAISKVLNVRAYIVGGPIYSTQGSQWTEAELRDLGSSLGIMDRVGFVPFQSDPRWVYRSLDIVVHASNRPEPFGLTIVEAMACEKPVVVSADGGAIELFTEGESGFGFTPGKSEELARLVSKLISDGSLRSSMGSAARSRAMRDFSSRIFGDRLMEIYSRESL